MLSIPVQSQKISLKDADLDLSYADYRLEDIIDGTDDEDNLGYVFRGAYNGSFQQIYFHKSVTEEFERLLKPKFSKDDDAIPLIIRINGIEINEWALAGKGKSNVVSLSLSFFQEMEDGYILITDRIVNHLDLDGVLYEDLPNRIAESVFSAFDFIDLIVNANKPQLTWEDLWEYEPYQELPTRSPSEEMIVYEHYSDFMEGKPYESGNLEVSNQKGITILLDEDGKHNKNVWGVNSKGILYLNIGDRLIPLSQNRKGFSFKVEQPEIADALSDLGKSMLTESAFGLFSTAGAIDKYDIPLSRSTGFLDIKSIYDQSELKNREQLGSKNIIEFAPFGSVDEVLDIKLGNKTLIQLQKGEFFQVPTTFDSTELQACVDGKCQPIVVSESPMFRVICKKGTVSLDLFSEKERMRYLRNVDLRYWVGF